LLWKQINAFASYPVFAFSSANVYLEKAADEAGANKIFLSY
jgi:hypothetical protein